MSRQIELDIFNFMSKENASASQCVSSYLPFWRARGLSSTDVHIISHFLYSNGAYKEVIKLSLENLEFDEPISWYYLGKIFQHYEPDLNAPLYSDLKEYLREQRKLDEFTVSDLFSQLFPLEENIKDLQIQQKIAMGERHRQTILDQIRIFNQSRNYNIEKQTIQKFKRFFPNDPLAKELIQRFEYEDLQRFFQRYKNEKSMRPYSKVKTFTPHELEFLENYFQQILLQIKTHSHVKVPEDSDPSNEHLIDGFVYFFIFLEDYDHALKLIPSMKESHTKDWLNLDLLIWAHRFAEALAFIRELEVQYVNDPEFYATKIYYVAQCLWGLGDSKKSIELMENLSKIKLNYRLSSTFLKSWRASS